MLSCPPQPVEKLWLRLHDLLVIFLAEGFNPGLSDGAQVKMFHLWMEHFLQLILKVLGTKVGQMVGNISLASWRIPTD